MPRRTRTEPLEAALREFSRLLGLQLAAGIEQGMRAAIAGTGAGRPANLPGAAMHACQVPGCGRDAISKGLCQNHYQKARRLRLPLGELSPSQLQELAQDRRVLRGKR